MYRVSTNASPAMLITSRSARIIALHEVKLITPSRARLITARRNAPRVDPYGWVKYPSVGKKIEGCSEEHPTLSVGGVVIEVALNKDDGSTLVA